MAEAEAPKKSGKAKSGAAKPGTEKPGEEKPGEEKKSPPKTFRARWEETWDRLGVKGLLAVEGGAILLVLAGIAWLLVLPRWEFGREKLAQLRKLEEERKPRLAEAKKNLETWIGHPTPAALEKFSREVFDRALLAGGEPEWLRTRLRRRGELLELEMESTWSLPGYPGLVRWLAGVRRDRLPIILNRVKVREAGGKRILVTISWLCYFFRE